MKNVLLFLMMILTVQLKAQETALPKDSIYHVKSIWKTQNNQPISLKDFRGEEVIVTMVYTGCAHSCPMMVSKLQEIEAAFIKKGQKIPRFVVASFDVKNDTPAALKKYMRARGLDESRWTFLSAPDEATSRELAVVLGINYKNLGDGIFSHSNVITYLDKNGAVSKVTGTLGVTTR